MPKVVIEGVLYKIGETAVLGKPDKPFYKREFIVETTEAYGKKTYKEMIKMFVTGQDVNMLDRFDVGDRVSINAIIRGSRWESKKDGKEVFFTELIATWIKHADDVAVQPEYKEKAEQPVTQKNSTQNQLVEEQDDLPF